MLLTLITYWLSPLLSTKIPVALVNSLFSQILYFTKIYFRKTSPNISTYIVTFFYVPETHIMYFIRRCWFLKCSEEIHYVPIGDGDMWYYVPVDDGWEKVLGHNVYIMSQYFSPNAKYWTASSGNPTRAPQIECGRSTIELWNLYIMWLCLYISSQYFSPNAKILNCIVRESNPGPPWLNVDALPLSYEICT